MNSRATPLVLVTVILLLGVLVHLDNDGLWYQGDSPRHFMNGVFWGDFAKEMAPLKAKEFAMEYYKRYPAIAPTIWPPFVYIAEALAFAVTGPSIPVARGIVVAFSLLGAVYLVLLLQRWGAGPEAATVAAWAVAQPLWMMWTNVVMMEIPALALGIAGIYHLDRATEESGRRQAVFAAVFIWSCAMTRLVGILLPASYVVMLVVAGRGRRLLRRDHLLVWGLGALALVPWMVVMTKYGSIMIREISHLGRYPRWSLENWTYYFGRLPTILGVPFILTAGIGLAVTALQRQTRRVGVTLLGSSILIWIVLTYISHKQGRYIISALPFLTGGAALGVQSFLNQWTGRWRTVVGTTVVILLGVLAGWRATALSLPRVTGMEQAVGQILPKAPSRRILYDGYYDGVFVAYVRSHPAGEEFAVVRGSKVFYATALQAWFGLVENATDVKSLERIVADVGCRWLVIEREEVTGIETAQLLRETLPQHPLFRHVSSFPLDTNGQTEVTYLDVYEYLGELRENLEEHISFPALDQ